MMAAHEPEFSLVIPVLNEEDNLRPLCRRIQEVFSGLSASYEVIFVDDGSTDGSLDILKAAAANDPHIRALGLKRNYGQSAAMAAGFRHARGTIVVTLDADLQNSPEDIPMLVSHLKQGYDVVSGWRRRRRDAFLVRTVPSVAANKIISLITGVRLHDYGCTLKVYRKEVVQDIRLYGEMHRFLPALAVWAGGRIAEVEVRHAPRVCGRSKYGLTRIFKVLIDLITVKFLMHFETRPNYIFGGLGFVSMSLGCAALMVVAYRLFVLQSREATPLVFMMVVFFVSGVQLILMGLLAEMLMRTYFESQDKPVYLIKEKINIQ
jgi:glycosyltransferase involved in cell wall biosynthesis